MDELQVKGLILQSLTILKNNIKAPMNKKIPFKEIRGIIDDLANLFSVYWDINRKACSKLSTNAYIPTLNFYLKADNNQKDATKYFEYLKDAYKYSAHTCFKSYLIYREWDNEPKLKFYSPRRKILAGAIYYLEKMTYDPNLLTIILNLPSGYGKTYLVKLYEAWDFGVDDTGTDIYLCSNDNVVRSGSATVRQEIKSEAFGDAFPELRWTKDKKDYFLKETDEMWKLKNCQLAMSYLSETTESNVVGHRANKHIHIDDLYKDGKDAMDIVKNKDLFNRNSTVWRKRFVQDAEPKEIITGTLWATNDFIDLVTKMYQQESEFIDSQFPYTKVSKNGKFVIVKVPALDYDTGLSSCPELRSTESINFDKRNMPEYLFLTNFQQLPTDPEGLMFSYSKLLTYTELPTNLSTGSFASIDSNRKTGKDFFSMPIFKQKESANGDKYYLIDAIYTKRATKDLYVDIANKIIQHHITYLVVESNATSELAQNVQEILEAHGYYSCKMILHWTEANKQTRITTQSYLLTTRFVYPARDLAPESTEIGRFMTDFTTYNVEGSNRHDDAPDSICLFAEEKVDKYKPTNKITVFKRPW